MSTLDPAWRRLHPLTPLLRGGRLLLILGAVAGQQGWRQAGDIQPIPLGLAVLAATGLAVLVSYVLWRTTRYRVTSTELQVDSGLLTKRSRRVPLARLQSVDVVRPAVARVLGVAELRLEVVGGGSAEAPLAYLSEADAQRLRRSILALAAGREEQPESADNILVVVPTGTLVASTLLAAPVVVSLLLVPILVAVAAVDLTAAGAVTAALLPVWLGLLTVSVRRVLTEYGFTVAESPDGLRLRHGLLDTRSQTIPAGRVQTVRIREPLLWRPWGWVRVEVDVAGYGSRKADQQAATSALLPVAPRALGDQLVRRILGSDLPELDPVPARARWRAPLSHRRLAAGVDAQHLVSTYGVLTTTTDVVPLAKVQSLRMTRGPWQRRLGLATVHADTAGRRLSGAAARHRDADQATALLDQLQRLARAARRTG